VRLASFRKKLVENLVWKEEKLGKISQLYAKWLQFQLCLGKLQNLISLSQRNSGSPNYRRIENGNAKK
jgi:hypothetical protein